MASKIDVNCTIAVIEINGKITELDEVICIKNHWNRPDGVILEISGTEYLINGTALELALRAVRKAHG